MFGPFCSGRWDLGTFNKRFHWSFESELSEALKPPSNAQWFSDPGKKGTRFGAWRIFSGATKKKWKNSWSH